MDYKKEIDSLRQDLFYIAVGAILVISLVCGLFFNYVVGVSADLKTLTTNASAIITKINNQLVTHLEWHKQGKDNEIN